MASEEVMESLDRRLQTQDEDGEEGEGDMEHGTSRRKVGSSQENVHRRSRSRERKGSTR